MTAPRDRGFTLIEVVIALSIIGATLGIALGALRVGLAAWRQGEARAAGLQHTRSLSAMLDHVVGGAYPYRAGAAAGGSLVFDGEPERLGFVTATPAVPPPRPRLRRHALARGRRASPYGRARSPPATSSGDRPRHARPRRGRARFRYLGARITPGTTLERQDEARCRRRWR
jgi:prepilin-type N-terminal cleavage/methylation domain-containing protein